MLRRHPRSRRPPRLSPRLRRRRRGAPLRLLYQHWQQDVSTLPACLEVAADVPKQRLAVFWFTLPRDPGALQGGTFKPPLGLNPNP